MCAACSYIHQGQSRPSLSSSPVSPRHTHRPWWVGKSVHWPCPQGSSSATLPLVTLLRPHNLTARCVGYLDTWAFWSQSACHGDMRIKKKQIQAEKSLDWATCLREPVEDGAEEQHWAVWYRLAWEEPGGGAGTWPLSQLATSVLHAICLSYDLGEICCFNL